MSSDKKSHNDGGLKKIKSNIKKLLDIGGTEKPNTYSRRQEDAKGGSAGKDGRKTREYSKIDEKQNLQHMVFSCPVDHSGTEVYVKGWIKPKAETPPVVIVHGLGENIGHYQEVAKIIGEAGFSVFGFDMRGHGRSGRGMGHIPKFDTLVKDLLQVISWIRFKSKRRVPYILCHGVGALVAIYFQRAYPNLCRGLIMVSPCINDSVAFSTKISIKLLAEISPTLRLPNSIVPAFFLIDNSPRKENKTGKTISRTHKITANFANEIIFALRSVEDTFSQYDCSTLILCPGKDSGYSYSKLFEMIGRHRKKEQFNVVEIDSKRFHVLTKSEHSRDEALSHIIPWLKEQVGIKVDEEEEEQVESVEEPNVESQEEGS